MVFCTIHPLRPRFECPALLASLELRLLLRLESDSKCSVPKRASVLVGTSFARAAAASFEGRRALRSHWLHWQLLSIRRLRSFAARSAPTRADGPHKKCNTAV